MATTQATMSKMAAFMMTLKTKSTDIDTMTILQHNALMRRCPLSCYLDAHVYDMSEICEISSKFKSLFQKLQAYYFCCLFQMHLDQCISRITSE